MRNRQKFRNTLTVAAAALCPLLILSCHRLSDQAQKMTGHYYISEISLDQPLLELNPDATCTVRAIKPGVLTFAVKGTWNVENDSLIIDTDPQIIEMEGDSTLIGDIPSHISRVLKNFNGTAMTLSDGENDFVYIRRSPDSRN